MNAIYMHPHASWYVEGLRWIGSLFHSAADRLSRPAAEPAPLEPYGHHKMIEEYFFDMRDRANRF